MAATVHPMAIVDPMARLGDRVSIGPFCVVGPDVELGEGVILMSHVVVDGRTRIGAGTRIFPFACIGLIPQDLKYQGEPSELVIGRDNIIREYVTMNPGTAGGGMMTRVGNGCLFMVGAHVAHDCAIGDQVIMANNASLGGHVDIGNHAILGGLSAVHQFVRIGEHAFIGGMTGVEQDVIPYGMVVGERGYLAGLNLVGLKRRGFDRDDIHRLRAAYRTLFQDDGELAERIDMVAQTYGGVSAVEPLLAFLRAGSDRKILKPKLMNAV